MTTDVNAWAERHELLGKKAREAMNDCAFCLRDLTDIDGEPDEKCLTCDGAGTDNFEPSFGDLPTALRVINAVEPAIDAVDELTDEMPTEMWMELRECAENGDRAMFEETCRQIVILTKQEAKANVRKAISDALTSGDEGGGE